MLNGGLKELQEYENFLFNLEFKGVDLNSLPNIPSFNCSGCVFNYNYYVLNNNIVIITK